MGRRHLDRTGIYPRGKGSWRIVVSKGRDPLTGEPRISRRTFRGTAQEAYEERQRLLRGPHTSGGGSVDVFLADYVEHRQVVLGKIRPVTRERYEGLLARYVLPMLTTHRGEPLKLVDVEPAHIRKIETAMLAGDSERGWVPQSSSTVLQLHRMLHAAFKTAVREGLTQTNPLDAVEPPAARRPKLTTPSAFETDAILEASRADGLGSTRPSPSQR
jgi:hypothetical protein